MPKGITISNEVVGTGPEALRGMQVVANVRIYLNRGEEVTAEYPESPRTEIDLGRRETIAGLRYGIEGMRVGGRRKLIISPHLAYGKKGSGSCIPPHAVLHCDVELLEILGNGQISTHEHPAGKYLTVFLGGEVSTVSPRRQINLSEDGWTLAHITWPIPGVGWRRAPSRIIDLELSRETAGNLISEALELPVLHPEACLTNEQVATQVHGSKDQVTRAWPSGEPCVSLSVIEKGKYLSIYCLRENDPVWLSSRLYEALASAIHPVR